MRAQQTRPDPGWYPDPGRADDTWRWWSGTGWTALLTTDEHTPPPDPALRLLEVEGQPRRFRVRRITAIVTGAVVLLLVLAAGASAVLRLPSTDPGRPRGPVPSSPAPTALPAWSGSGLEMRFGALATGALPGAPYGAPHEVGGSSACDDGSSNEFLVDDDPEWYAVAVSCWVSEDLSATTLADTVTLTARSLLEDLYDGEDLAAAEQTEVPGFTAAEALMLTGRIDTSASGSGNAYDEMVVIVLQPDPRVSRYALWASFVPEHTPAAAKQAMAAAQAALRHA